MKRNSNGFTLMELLIVIAIIAVLIAIAIPIFVGQLEKSREMTDLANARSAYAQVSAQALLGDTDVSVSFDLKQQQADWQKVSTINVGGIIHRKGEGDTANWKGVPKPGGSCTVSYSEEVGVIIDWNGEGSSNSKYPFNTGVSDFFPMLYDTQFWKDGRLKYNNRFEFDSRCTVSDFVPSIKEQIEKEEYFNCLLQQPECTWAYLGDGRANKEAGRYMYWTSLNTQKVGAGKKIPVIIQTGDGKYYVSETTTGVRSNKDYVTVSVTLYESNHQQILKNGAKYESLEEAYDAYTKALSDSKYDAVRKTQTQTQSQSQPQPQP